MRIVYILLLGIIGLTCFYYLSMQTRTLGYGVAKVNPTSCIRRGQTKFKAAYLS